MSDEQERELTLHRSKERQRERERQIEEAALSLLVSLRGGPNHDRNPYLAPTSSAAAFGAQLLTERTLRAQYDGGRSEGLLEGAHRALEWVRERLLIGGDLLEQLEAVDPEQIAFDPEDGEMQAAFEIRHEAAALSFAAADRDLRRVRSAHKRLGVLLQQTRSLSDRKRGRRSKRSE